MILSLIPILKKNPVPINADNRDVSKTQNTDDCMFSEKGTELHEVFG